MLEILRPTTRGLHHLEKPEKGSWVNLIRPSVEELAQLRESLDIPEEFLTTLQDMEEIPTVELHEKFIFLIIRTPHNNLKVDLEYYTVPIGVFVAKDVVVTICYHENDVVERLKSKRFDFSTTQFIFRLLLSSARLYLSYLNEISKKMYSIESALEKSQKNEVILQLLELQKALVYFNTSLKGNDILVERMTRDRILLKSKEDRELVAKLLDEQRQGLELTSIYSNILSNTLDAFASIISNNLNIVMKVLASITLMLMFPTLVASVYGMNVPLPFQHSPHAFAIVMSISLAFSAGGAYFLWRRKMV